MSKYEDSSYNNRLSEEPQLRRTDEPISLDGQPLADAAEYLKEVEARIKRAHPEASGFRLDISVEDGHYDSSHYVRVVVEYQRPETREEITARIADWKQRDEREAAKDREVFERLKKKFG